jgi:hypothetical protein
MVRMIAVATAAGVLAATEEEEEEEEVAGRWRWGSAAR